jgi:hypothetical protein
MPPSKHRSSPSRLPVRISNRSSLLKKLERETRWLEVEGEEGTIRHGNPPSSSIMDVSSIHDPDNHRHQGGGMHTQDGKAISPNKGRLLSDPSFEEEDLSLPIFSVKGPMPLHRTVAGPLSNNANKRGVPSSHFTIQQFDSTPPRKSNTYPTSASPKAGVTFQRDQKHCIGKLLLPIGQKPSSLSFNPPPTEGRGRSGSLAPPLPTASTSNSLALTKKNGHQQAKGNGKTDGPPTTHADIYVDEAGVVRRGDNAVTWLKSAQKAHFAGAYSSEYETSSATYIPGVDVPPSAVFTALTETRRLGSPERAHKLAHRMVQDQFSPHFTSSSQSNRLKVGRDDSGKSKLVGHQQGASSCSTSRVNTNNTCPDNYVLEALRKHFTPSRTPLSSASGGTSVEGGLGAAAATETTGDTHLLPLNTLPASYRSPFVPRALRPARSSSFDGINSLTPALCSRHPSLTQTSRSEEHWLVFVVFELVKCVPFVYF